MSKSTQFTQSYNANNDWYCFTHLENSSNNLQYSGIGSNITGIQSESYLNTTNIEISETTSEFSVSNPSSDLYYLDSLEIISADVTVSNFTQIIENNTETIAGNITDVEFIQYAFSFIAPPNSYLDMFQLYFYAPTETATIDFYLAKASYDLSQERINIDPVSIDLELNYTLSFNQNGIENASFECNVDSTHIFNFDNSSLYVQNNGLYQFNLSIFELTIGFHNVSVTFNNTYYESQTIFIEFEINFNTELIIDTNVDNLTEIPFGYSEIFVISIEFKTINDERISNANITYYINNTIGSIEIIDYENGTYQLELDISDFESDLYIISIFASKQFYISQNDTIMCTILEEIIPEPEPEPEPPIPPYVIPLIVIGIMCIIAGIVYFLKNRLVFKKLPINI